MTPSCGARAGRREGGGPLLRVPWPPSASPYRTRVTQRARVYRRESVTQTASGHDRHAHVTHRGRKECVCICPTTVPVRVVPHHSAWNSGVNTRSLAWSDKLWYTYMLSSLARATRALPVRHARGLAGRVESVTEIIGSTPMVRLRRVVGDAKAKERPHHCISLTATASRHPSFSATTSRPSGAPRRRCISSSRCRTRAARSRTGSHSR